MHYSCRNGKCAHVLRDQCCKNPAHSAWVSSQVYFETWMVSKMRCYFHPEQWGVQTCFARERSKNCRLEIRRTSVLSGGLIIRGTFHVSAVQTLDHCKSKLTARYLHWLEHKQYILTLKVQPSTSPLPKGGQKYFACVCFSVVLAEYLWTPK